MYLTKVILPPHQKYLSTSGRHSKHFHRMDNQQFNSAYHLVILDITVFLWSLFTINIYDRNIFLKYEEISNFPSLHCLLSWRISSGEEAADNVLVETL